MGSLFMTLIPNPINLPMTITVALLRYPPPKFLLFSFLGIGLRSLLIAFSGYYGIDMINHWIIGFSKVGFVTSPVAVIILVLSIILLVIFIWQIIVWINEVRDKNRKYQAAYNYAKKNGKTVAGNWRTVGRQGLP